MTGLRRAVVVLVALPLLAGCSAVDPSATSVNTAASAATSVNTATSVNCLDAMPGSGDLGDRTRMASGVCPAPAAVSIPEAASRPAPASPAPSATATPRPGPVPASPTVPAASLRPGQRSPAGGGSYVMWIKAENHVYLVRSGRVIRVMPTTGLAWKTPPGSYQVTYKELNAASLDGRRTWVLPYFVAFWRRPGADGDIAFHQVPHDAGNALAQPLDTVGQTGKVSDGCARMRPADARAIWEFTRVGTRVVVR